MILTNKFNLPQPFVDAILNDEYDKGDAYKSISGLLKPPKASAIEEKHFHEIEQDVIDHTFALLGKVAHGILERAEKSALTEQRLYGEINKVRYSGKFDRFHFASKHLLDWKVTSVWKATHGLPKDFEEQTNCYVELIRANNYDVDKVQIVMILRDWSKMQALRDRGKGYPQSQVVVMDVPIWPREKTQAFLCGRIKAHKAAEIVLPECTPEERWAKPATFAVKKIGGKSAIKFGVYESKELAEARLKNEGVNYFIEERPGASNRCEFYCSANKWCEQYQKTLSSPALAVGSEDV